MVPIPVPSLSKVKKEPQDEQKEGVAFFELLKKETLFKDYLLANTKASGPQVVAWLKRNDKKSYQQLPGGYKKPNARVTKKQVIEAVNGLI